MNIRPMRREDIERVMQIAAALPEAPHWPESAYAAAVDPEATPRRIALIAEDAQCGITGFAVALVIPPEAELETIAVAESAQRRGIAGCLVAEMFTTLKRLQITEIVLEVRESNRIARRLYARAGFADAGRRTGYYSEPEEDAILLHRSLW